MKVKDIIKYFETSDMSTCDTTDGVLLYDLVVGVLRRYITTRGIDVTSNDISVLYIVCVYNDMSPSNVIHQHAKDINSWGQCVSIPSVKDCELIVAACKELIQSEHLL